MNHKTIDEYFCERKLNIGRLIYVNGLEHILMRPRSGYIGLYDVTSFTVEYTCPFDDDIGDMYVSREQFERLLYDGDIVHIPITDMDGDTIDMDEYFGERKIPIGSLVMLDGVEHMLIRSGRGGRCSLISTDTWAEARFMTNVSSTYTDGLTRQQLHLLSKPYASIVIGDTDE